MTKHLKPPLINPALAIALGAIMLTSLGPGRAAEPVPEPKRQLGQTGPKSPAGQTPSDPSRIPAASSAASKEPRKRGRLPDLTTMCDVAPPCPVGCREDVKKNMCIESPTP